MPVYLQILLLAAVFIAIVIFSLHRRRGCPTDVHENHRRNGGSQSLQGKPGGGNSG